MRKCIKCGNEILSGDIHWEMGLCNKCYNELYKDHKTHISLDKMWLELAQDFRDENEQLQTKITDLQSQLQQANEIINNPDTLIFQQQQLIDNLKSQLAEKEKEKEKEKEMSIKSIIRTLVKYNNLNCTFRDKTNSQIQQCGDVYNSNYGYFNFEDDYDECLNNRNDSRFDIISIDLDNQDKISFAVDILEELAGCSNYINSKLDFECGSYVSEKAIRDKIKYLKGKKDE